LIAGPIVYHKELVPQFRKKLTESSNGANIAIGITFFSIGLFKKVFIADSLSPYADAVFFSANQGLTLTFFEAWGGALAYTLQIYFDFSGYTDMAIGIARIFGIILPINFYSPYKASSIIDFWKRWHMTLSRFLKEYLYFKIGGNKLGSFRQYLNIIIVMSIGGLWHGSSWNFIIWGFFHGVLIIINHLMIKCIKHLRIEKFLNWLPLKLLSILITFILVTISWVIFRAENMQIAFEILKSMLSLDRMLIPNSIMQQFSFIETLLFNAGVTVGNPFYNGIINWRNGSIILILSLCIVWFLPNTNQIFKNYYKPSNKPKFLSERILIRINWEPKILWIIVISIYLIISIIMLSSTSSFLYFIF